jgi:hypothetical protein
MRWLVTSVWLLSCPLSSAVAQVSVGIGLPSVSIGFDLQLYPTLIPVPGYPVYYAPDAASNYFFYDGLYWVYQEDSWYSSSWYNGPWTLQAPDLVPAFILRVPVRYYRHPPAYFAGWRSDAPPRWGEHWGAGWQRQHRGWDRWDRRSTPRPAPLPAYQSRYSGARYPQPDQQRALHTQNYSYRPRDPAVQQGRQAQQHDGPPPARQVTGGDRRGSSQPAGVQRAGPGSPAPARNAPRASGNDRGREARSGTPEPKGHPDRPRDEQQPGRDR